MAITGSDEPLLSIGCCENHTYLEIDVYVRKGRQRSLAERVTGETGLVFGVRRSFLDWQVMAQIRHTVPAGTDIQFELTMGW